MKARYESPDDPPDFNELARKFPDFAPHVKVGRGGQPTLDWRDPEAVMQLTLALLKDRHGLSLELPPDQLCPTVTLRENYVRLIADLVKGRKGHQIRGVDVGTGASCIYALLGARVHGWQFVGTEASQRSAEYAQRNVDANGLGALVEVRRVQPSQVFEGVLRPGEEFDFTMCNPPFFASREDAAPSRNPHTACTAAEHEMVTSGGEEVFVGRMIDESRALASTPGGPRVRWWTSMLGRKASLKSLRARAIAARAGEVKVAELRQGRTTRWVLAWTMPTEILEHVDVPVVLPSEMNDPEVLVDCVRSFLQPRCDTVRRSGQFAIRATVSARVPVAAAADATPADVGPIGPPGKPAQRKTSDSAEAQPAEAAPQATTAVEDIGPQLPPGKRHREGEQSLQQEKQETEQIGPEMPPAKRTKAAHEEQEAAPEALQTISLEFEVAVYRPDGAAVGRFDVRSCLAQAADDQDDEREPNPLVYQRWREVTDELAQDLQDSFPTEPAGEADADVRDVEDEDGEQEELPEQEEGHADENGEK
eukprot:m51a1_g11306 putative methyltransferase-like protein 16 (535) ;mRNA; r:79067-80937